MSNETPKVEVPLWVFLIPAAMSLVALADLPYGYYQFLRIVVTICTLWIAFSFYQAGYQVIAVVFGILAIIFNPIAKIHMEKDIHAIFNILTAIILIVGLWFQKKRVKH